MANARVVKGMPGVELSKEVFAERFRARFHDPAFDQADSQIEALLEIAWKTFSATSEGGIPALIIARAISANA